MSDDTESTNKIHGGLNNSSSNKISYYIKKYKNNPYRLNHKSIDIFKSQAQLSFYPISKNIRMISSIVAENLAKGKITKFSKKAKKGEAKFVKHFLGWQSWYPWIWTRWASNNKLSNLESWSIFFDFTADRNYAKKQKREVLKLNQLEKIYAKIGIYVFAIGKVFQLNELTKKEVLKIIPNEFFNLNSKVIGVHIRRGENVSGENDIKREGFIFFDLSVYFNEIRKVSKQLNTKKIYLCTDSTEVINFAKAELKEYTLFYSNIDRDKFFRPTSTAQISLETLVANDTQMAKFYSITSIADLYALSKCDYIVGTISISEFSKTAWYLAMAEKNSFVPFSSISGPLDLNKSDSVYLN